MMLLRICTNWCLTAIKLFVVSALASIVAVGPTFLLIYKWLANRSPKPNDIFSVPALKLLFDNETKDLLRDRRETGKTKERTLELTRLHNSWYYGKGLNGYWVPLIGNQIRLLDIHPGKFSEPIRCSLYVKPLESKTRFVALSYAWGDLDNLRAICVNGTYGFVVSETAYHALRRIRACGEKRLVWIDAICINQSVNFERGHQIGLMNRIYSVARYVYVYLGPCNSGGEYSGDVEVETCPKHTTSILENPPHVRVDTVWMQEIYPRESQWWYRVWTVSNLFKPQDRSPTGLNIYCQVQETVLARDILVLIGPHRYTWKDIMGLVRCRRLPGNANESIAALDDLRYAWNTQAHGLGLKLSELLQRTALRKATEPLDKVYGLLGLAQNPVTADYTKSMEQLNKEVTRHIISKEQSLDIYLLGSWHRQTVSPKWSLQFDHAAFEDNRNALDLCMEFSGMRPLATLTSDFDTQFEGEHMICRGLTFDTIEFKIDFLKHDTATIHLGENFQMDPTSSQRISLEHVKDKWERVDILAVEMQHLARELVSRLPRKHNNVSRIFRDSKIADWNYRERFKSKGTNLGIFHRESSTSKIQRVRSVRGKKPDPAFRRYAQHCSDNVPSGFFITSQGFVGVAYRNAVRLGDWVTVLFGASMPLILRPNGSGYVGDHFEIISGAYVSCIMQGEIIELYRDARPFTIV